MLRLPIFPAKPPADPVERAFLEFWKAYPKRPVHPKALARAYFRKLTRTVDPQVIVEAAGRYARAVARDGTRPEFIPYAATWLNQRRFEDWQEEPAAEPEPTVRHPLQTAFPDLSEAQIRAWIDPLEIVRDGEVVVLRCPSAVHAEQLRANYDSQLRRGLRAAQLRYEVRR